MTESSKVVTSENPGAEALTELTARIVSAYVANHNVPPESLSGLIASTHKALESLSVSETKELDAVEKPTAQLTKAEIRKTVSEDGLFLTCLEDGKRFKSMKRHLKNSYNMTPDEYRKKWGLPADYPMVAPKYSTLRSKLAKEGGLGLLRRKAA